MAETGVMSQACQSISVGCQAPKHSATHSSWRFETATCCSTESLEDGADSIDLVSAKPLHADGAMGLPQVKPEGGEGEA
jgi:hypothetical protein